MVQSQQTCATGRTDGFIEIRDERGRLWCEYHPERQVIRHYHKHTGKRLLYTAEIPINSLIAGQPVVNLTCSALPD